VSSTLREPLTWPNTRLIAGDAEPVFAGYQRAGLDLLASTVLDGRIVLVEYRRVPGR
jgi:hypothetical protein